MQAESDNQNAIEDVSERSLCEETSVSDAVTKASLEAKSKESVCQDMGLLHDLSSPESKDKVCGSLPEVASSTTEVSESLHENLLPVKCEEAKSAASETVERTREGSDYNGSSADVTPAEEVSENPDNKLSIVVALPAECDGARSTEIVENAKQESEDNSFSANVTTPAEEVDKNWENKLPTECENTKSVEGVCQEKMLCSSNSVKNLGKKTSSRNGGDLSIAAVRPKILLRRLPENVEKTTKVNDESQHLRKIENGEIGKDSSNASEQKSILAEQSDSKAASIVKKRRGRRGGKKVQNPPVLGYHIGYCYVCHYALYSTRAAINHFKGNQHQDRMQMIEAMTKNRNATERQTSTRTTDANRKFFCQVCEKYVNSAQQLSKHTESNRHKKKVQNREEGNGSNDASENGNQSQNANLNGDQVTGQMVQSSNAKDAHSKDSQVTCTTFNNNSKDANVDSKDAHVDSKDAHVDSKDAHVDSKDAHVDSKDAHVDSKDAHVDSKDAHVDRNQVTSASVHNSSEDTRSNNKQLNNASNQSKDTHVDLKKEKPIVLLKRKLPDSKRDTSKDEQIENRHKQTNPKTLPSPSEMDFHRYDEWLHCQWPMVPQGRGRALNLHRRGGRDGTWQSNIENHHPSFNSNMHYYHAAPLRGRGRGIGRQPVYSHLREEIHLRPQSSSNYAYSEFGHSHGYNML
ncbi:uncharacterized protein [Antedon mediterranea]|uniref:uncharacterized protein n=1 Tax=Antedon mediterranea TaxID=105859 RepID=UPI003AF8B927